MLLEGEVDRDPTKPYVKRIEGFDPPKYGVELHGVVVTQPADFDKALHQANAIAVTNNALGTLFTQALDSDIVAAADALEYIFPGESDVDPCP